MVATVLRPAAGNTTTGSANLARHSTRPRPAHWSSTNLPRRPADSAASPAKSAHRAPSTTTRAHPDDVLGVPTRSKTAANFGSPIGDAHAAAKTYDQRNVRPPASTASRRRKLASPPAESDHPATGPTIIVAVDLLSSLGSAQRIQKQQQQSATNSRE